MNKQKESVKGEKSLTNDYRDYLSEYMRSDFPSVIFTEEEEVEETEDGEVNIYVTIYGFDPAENNPDYPIKLTLNPVEFCGVFDKEGNFLFNTEPSDGYFKIKNYEGSKLVVFEFDPFTSEFDLRLMSFVEELIGDIYEYVGLDFFKESIDEGTWINIEAIPNSKVKELVQNLTDRLNEDLNSVA